MRRFRCLVQLSNPPGLSFRFCSTTDTLTTAKHTCNCRWGKYTHWIRYVWLCVSGHLLQLVDETDVGQPHAQAGAVAAEQQLIQDHPCTQARSPRQMRLWDRYNWVAYCIHGCCRIILLYNARTLSGRARRAALPERRKIPSARSTTGEIPRHSTNAFEYRIAWGRIS